MCTINNTKHFIEQIKNVEIPNSYEMVSFDLKPLLTNIPLEKNNKKNFAKDVIRKRLTQKFLRN